MKVEGGEFLVAGLGKTGIAVSRFLACGGASVTATDIRPQGDIPAARDLERLGVKIEAGGHREESFVKAGTVVLSPGVPPDTEPVRAAVAAGVEVIGEAELAFRVSRLPVVAITGSNGKTTATGLAAHILKRCGRRPFVGGNFGDPFINAAGKEDIYDMALLEMSSFQLRTTSTFKPFIAVMLNISPNHLDVHPSYGDYFDSKKKIFANQTPDDWAVVNGSDSEALSMLGSSRAKTVVFVSGDSEPGPGRVTADGNLVSFAGETYDLSRMKIEGRHNLENAMSAIAVASILGCDSGKTAEAARDFSPLPHRMEFVCEISGARVYNDSKATNPGATLRALAALSPPVVLISGGKDKKTGYLILRRAVAEKVDSLVLFGQSAGAMMSELGGLAKTVVAGSLEEAVAVAVSRSRPGGSILFSPACSSFDMFSSFEERGGEFKKIVKKFK